MSSDAWLRAAAGAAFLASVTGFLSIAASHALLGVATLFLLLSRERWRVPGIWAPLGAFILWTLASAAASPEPTVAVPQVKKFYVFLFLPVLYTLLPRIRDARRLMEAWFVVGGVIALFASAQFVRKWFAARQAGEDFLTVYAPDRITGFFSHWMTFSQAALLAFTMLVGYLLFSRSAARGRGLWIAAAAAIGVGLVLSFTRSVWLAMVVVAAYYLARWRPRLLWAAPVAAVLLSAWAPEPLQRRIESIGDLQQNAVRIVMWRTGWRMIQDRPLFGVGPQRVGREFDRYEPDDVVERPPGYYEHLHNVYVHYAAERGLPAAAAVVWLLLKILWDLGRELRRAPPGASDRRFLLEGAVASTLATATVACFDLTLGDSEVLAAFLGVIAVGYRARDGDALQAAMPAPSSAREQTAEGQPASAT